jgi:hypothetical protein
MDYLVSTGNRLSISLPRLFRRHYLRLQDPLLTAVRSASSIPPRCNNKLYHYFNYLKLTMLHSLSYY